MKQEKSIKDEVKEEPSIILQKKLKKDEILKVKKEKLKSKEKKKSVKKSVKIEKIC